MSTIVTHNNDVALTKVIEYLPYKVEIVCSGIGCYVLSVQRNFKFNVNNFFTSLNIFNVCISNASQLYHTRLKSRLGLLILLEKMPSIFSIVLTIFTNTTKNFLRCTYKRDKCLPELT